MTKWREDQETKFLKSKRYKRLVRKYGDEEVVCEFYEFVSE